ncbi:MAG: biopolymer transporter ExbD [Proteobacteria bacterium]|nr:biopolymer transporter ExbD [Pseudomonadota bacterium]
MSSRKKRKWGVSQPGPDAPELNIMPFIDIFSMLNTFLLVSAAFIGLGIIEVQVPFLSNSPEVKELPERSFSVRVDIEDAEIKVTSLWTAAPIDKQEKTFKTDDAEIGKFHQEMIALRTKVPENDKVTVYSADTVKYEILVKSLDAMKSLKENEPKLALPNAEERRKQGKDLYLYEKVVIGSVIL